MALHRSRRSSFRPTALIIATVTAAAGLMVPAAAHAAVNDAPIVVPELQSWGGGTGDTRIDADSRIVADAESADVASQLVDDVNAITGLTLEVTSGDAQPGDIVLDLQPELTHPDGGQRDLDDRPQHAGCSRHSPG